MDEPKKISVEELVAYMKDISDMVFNKRTELLGDMEMVNILDIATSLITKAYIKEEN